MDCTIILQKDGYEAYLGLHGEGLDSHESEVFGRHGEPVVECGGVVVHKEMDVILQLDEDLRAFPSQFPLRRKFPFTNARANDHAIAFLATVTKRLVDARDRLLELHPTTIGDDVMAI